MIDFDVTIWASVVVVAFLTAIIFARLYLAREIESRSICLDLASAAWESHKNATLKFLDDPAPSIELKELLVSMSLAIGTRKQAKLLAEKIYDGPGSKNGQLAGEISEIISEVDSLRKSRKDLIELFDTAFAAGLVALFNRWPETQAVFSKIQTEVASDRTKRIAVAARISKLTKNDARNDNFPGLGGGYSTAAC